MSAVSKAINALNEGLVLVVNAGGSLDKADRLVHAEATLRGVLRMLESRQEVDPARRLYAGEVFTVFERFCDAAGTSGIITADLEYAKTGEHDFTSRPAGDFYEDALIDVLRADLDRVLAGYGTAPAVEGNPYERAALGMNMVSADEIDEDPPEEPHIISAPGGVLYSDGSIVDPDDSDAPDEDNVGEQGPEQA